MRPTILAATGQLGRPLIARLSAAGIRPVAVGRDPAKLRELTPIAETRVADFDDRQRLADALADATLVAACGNAVHLPNIVSSMPRHGIQRLVAMGSTRVFSAIPDPVGDAVRQAQALLAAAPFESVMLLASMIYGGGGGVVEQLTGLARRMPVLPVPAGTRLQPIHRDDVVLALEAAMTRPGICGKAIVIAGPEPMAYRSMVQRIIEVRGLHTMLLPVPKSLFALAGRLGGRGSLRRLAEDAVFDVAPMRAKLGIAPRAFSP